MRNDKRINLLKNTILATVGLFFFSVGVYLTIQANIGVAPWDAFNLGLVNTFGIKYGTASIIVSLVVVAVDLGLREKIGIGMLLDAILVGLFVDLFNLIGLIPEQKTLLTSLLVMAAGMIIMGFSQYLYMKAALGCGPRDTLLVGLSRRMKKVPIGLVGVMIMATVTLVGWLLGGRIGIGTLICAFLEGPIMQLDFKLVHFDATEVKHQDIPESFRILFSKKTGGKIE